jgi:hypothetical protein
MQLEAFEEVERAFVHVDYERREEPEHKVQTPAAEVTFFWHLNSCLNASLTYVVCPFL